MEQFLPSVNTISSETETEINRAVDAEMNRRRQLKKDSEQPIDSLYQEFQDKFPLDPLFKTHIESLIEENKKYTQWIEHLNNGGDKADEWAMELKNAISQAAKANPEKYNILASDLDKMQEETRRIYEEDIPALIQQFDELTRQRQAKNDQLNSK